MWPSMTFKVKDTKDLHLYNVIYKVLIRLDLNKRDIRQKVDF